MSPVPLAVILLTFFVSLYVTLRRGPAATFAIVLLPAILIAFTVTPLDINRLPDVDMRAAVGYGALLGIIVSGWRPTFQLNLVDVGVLALSLFRVVGGTANGVVWTGVSLVGDELLRVLVPYVLARAAFVDRHYRLLAAKVVAGIAIVMLPFVMVEWRLDPLFFQRRILAPLDLTNVNWILVQGRFGFFRAQGAFCHPIDLGNGGALLGVFIIALATSSGKKLTHPWVLAGVGSAFVMAMASMSFTSFVAVAAIAGLFVMLRWVPRSELLLIPIGIAAIIGYSALTARFVSEPPKAVEWKYYETPDEHSGSFFTRHLIVYNSWWGDKGAANAGLIGYGQNNIDQRRDYGLLSIDNSYVVFVLESGWGYLALFLLTAFAAAVQVVRAMGRVGGGGNRAPLAAGAAGVIGTMLGMYTVFFGFVYATMFWLLLALVASMTREVFERTGEAEPVQLDAGRDADDRRRAERRPGAFA